MTGKINYWMRVVSLGFCTVASVSRRLAQRPATVKITPIGARTGEFCGRDRALLFEDRQVRILYNPGITVARAADNRLGGPTSDMATIVRNFYHPNLAVVNVDGVSSMGPEEAAYAVKRLIRPKAVIASRCRKSCSVLDSLSPTSWCG